MTTVPNIYLNLIGELARVSILVIFCHFIGDYLFQTEYMAREKGKSTWILIAHCFCYSFPFLICFGVRWQLFLLLVSHYIIDIGKCNGLYGIFFDQYFHIVIAMTYIFPVFTEGSWRTVSL